jgi:hypothetical protein
MQKTLNEILKFLKKAGYFALEYICICYQWIIKFLKIRSHKWGKCRAKKGFEKARFHLGTEVYSLFKQKELEALRDIPSAKRQVENVESAEARIFEMEEKVIEAKRSYESRKLKTKEKYAASRAAVNVITPDETIAPDGKMD